jgi:hypothetical protein
MDLWGLHKALVAQFDSDELEALALGVSMSPSQFSNDKADVRATELIDFANRRGRLADLARCCTDVRAQIDWAAFVKEQPETPPAMPPPASAAPGNWTPAGAPAGPPASDDPSQPPPIAGMWQILNPMGQVVGWLRISPDYSFQFSGGWGQASGKWWWNTTMNLFQSQGAYLNGAVFSPSFSIQQWMPNGFIALGGDGILYAHIRAG